LLKADLPQARAELARVRTEFQQAIASGLVCAGFDRATVSYQLYERSKL
jgi:hypothetical protein